MNNKIRSAHGLDFFKMIFTFFLPIIIPNTFIIIYHYFPFYYYLFFYVRWVAALCGRTGCIGWLSCTEPRCEQPWVKIHLNSSGHLGEGARGWNEEKRREASMWEKKGINRGRRRWLLGVGRLKLICLERERQGRRVRAEQTELEQLRRSCITPQILQMAVTEPHKWSRFHGCVSYPLLLKYSRTRLFNI